MFELWADKNNLTLETREMLTSGSVNIYTVRFEFSDDWDGLTRTAVFQAGSVSRSILLDTSGVCTVPWEVLKTPGISLSAGVYGEKDGDVVLPTIWARLGLIMEGAAPGEDAQPPTPDLWEQELAKKQDKLYGRADQLVGFDNRGNAVPVDAGEAVQGPPGPGVPAGGSPGQVLTKKTSADYNTQWSDPTGGETGDIYSTEETVVGRWIDGKPLYRRVLEVTTPSSSTSTLVAELDETIQVKNIQGMVDGSDNFTYMYAANSCLGDKDWIRTSYTHDQARCGIVMNISVSSSQNRPATLIILYTKTTDQATIELPTAVTASPARIAYKAVSQSAAAATLDAGIRTEAEEV